MAPRLQAALALHVAQAQLGQVGLVGLVGLVGPVEVAGLQMEAWLEPGMNLGLWLG